MTMIRIGNNSAGRTWWSINLHLQTSIKKYRELGVLNPLSKDSPWNEKVNTKVKPVSNFFRVQSATVPACRQAGASSPHRLFFRADDFVHDAVFFCFFGRHKVISLHIFFNLGKAFAGIFG